MEFGIHMKLVRLLKMCLTETYRQTFANILPIRNGLKQDFFFASVLEYASGSVHVNQDGLQLSGTYQFLVYADDVYI